MRVVFFTIARSLKEPRPSQLAVQFTHTAIVLPLCHRICVRILLHRLIKSALLALITVNKSRHQPTDGETYTTP